MAAVDATSPSPVLRHDHVLPFVYPADLAGTDHRRAIELREDRRPREARAHIEPFALVDRAVELRAIEARALHAPACIRQCRAGSMRMSSRAKPSPCNSSRACVASRSNMSFMTSGVTSFSGAIFDWM